jgi:hypothetical protein
MMVQLVLQELTVMMVQLVLQELMVMMVQLVLQELTVTRGSSRGPAGAGPRRAGVCGLAWSAS